MSQQRITELLQDWNSQNPQSREELAALVYQELRQLARSYMRHERPDHTLQATALVHEAYLRLVDQRIAWKSRAHFVGVAATMMRRILVDHAKEYRASKRGLGQAKAPLDDALAVSEQPPVDLVALNDALTELEKIDPPGSQIVELRFFGGLSNDETANVLGISPATVQRRWAGARAWLSHQMGHQDKK